MEQQREEVLHCTRIMLPRQGNIFYIVSCHLFALSPSLKNHCVFVNLCRSEREREEIVPALNGDIAEENTGVERKAGNGGGGYTVHITLSRARAWSVLHSLVSNPKSARGS
ncbi:unnamed protein product [Eruca vesicaria subsp. sativa]|uniref:Uncharacterized protein n=1 Tax=Eruca vesicaria subsp. sativa TaxID=29727 RepID=A0ABC8IZU6_ERUVS|nr:unnamed protein product [Eruca vesicaria subsp. sativa]